MKWLDTLAVIAAPAGRLLGKALATGLVLLLVDVGLLDATVGRAAHGLLRPSALSSTLALSPLPVSVPLARW